MVVKHFTDYMRSNPTDPPPRSPGLPSLSKWPNVWEAAKFSEHFREIWKHNAKWKLDVLIETGIGGTGGDSW